MASGLIDYVSGTNGYGFITTDAVDGDVFFFMEEVGARTVTEGQAVEFDVREVPKGPRAENVQCV